MESKCALRAIFSLALGRMARKQETRRSFFLPKICNRTGIVLENWVGWGQYMCFVREHLLHGTTRVKCEHFNREMCWVREKYVLMLLYMSKILVF